MKFIKWIIKNWDVKDTLFVLMTIVAITYYILYLIEITKK